MNTLPRLAARLAFAAGAALAAAALPAPALAADAPAQAGDALPQAREVIARHVEAVGGEAAIRAKKSRTTKATIKYADNPKEGTVESYTAAPNQMVYVVDVPFLGKNMVGFNGKIAWAISKANGPQILTGRQADQVKEQALFFSSLYPPELYVKVQTVEKVSFEGVDCYKVALMTHSGTESVHFFDASTGLLAGTQEVRELGPDTKIDVINVVGDYKKFGDIMVATRTVQRVMGTETVTTIQSVEWDSVDPTYFELPREIASQLPSGMAAPRPSAPKAEPEAAPAAPK